MVSLYWIYFTVAPVSALRLTILVDFLINALLYKFYLGGTEVLYAQFNIIFILLFVSTLDYVPHRHSMPLISPINIVIHCGHFLVSRCRVVAISSLVDATSMCPAIFVKICRHWVTRLSFVRSGGSIRGLLIFFLPLFPLLE